MLMGLQRRRGRRAQLPIALAAPRNERVYSGQTTINIGTLTNIDRGTLVAPGGISLPSGNTLVARGTISGHIFAHGGSVIEATNTLRLGDPAAVDGFFSDGVLIVPSDVVVTLQDANEAVLGSLTSLDSSGAPTRRGTLDAPNGLIVEFG